MAGAAALVTLAGLIGAQRRRRGRARSRGTRLTPPPRSAREERVLSGPVGARLRSE